MPTHHIGNDAWLPDARAAHAVVAFDASARPLEPTSGPPLPILTASEYRDRYRSARLSEFAGYRLRQVCQEAEVLMGR